MVGEQASRRVCAAARVESRNVRLFTAQRREQIYDYFWLIYYPSSGCPRFKLHDSPSRCLHCWPSSAR
ncbi:hypothetical protein VTO42DRAFT_4277 [Malbranchea cinnamomea]